MSPKLTELRKFNIKGNPLERPQGLREDDVKQRDGRWKNAIRPEFVYT